MESLRSADTEDDVFENRTSNDLYNQRVVAFAPTLQDARLCQQILEQNNIAVCCCNTIESFAATIVQGAGIALIAQEHLSDAAIE